MQIATLIYLFVCQQQKNQRANSVPALHACASEGERRETLPNLISKGYNICNYYG